MEKKKFVSIVNACSELYFFADYCTHICEEPENFSEVVRSHAAEGLENLNTYFTKHVDSIVDTENRILTAKEKCFDHDLVSYIIEIEEEYNQGGDEWSTLRSPYWKKIEMPSSLRDAFDNYIHLLFREVPGLIKCVAPEDKDIPTGAAGIGLYDLSDITLLFDNKEHALDFAGDIADDLDPIDWLLWDDDRWIAWEV